MDRKMQSRINNCIKARNACSVDSWGYQFWDKTMNALVRKAGKKTRPIMPKNDITEKWFYQACTTQSDDWLVNNSQTSNGLFHQWQKTIMRKVLTERGLKWL
tara:strand:+ start:493 stop:798 length:306 start_codon:yes stop_codon:yes gene_type:complete